MEIKRELSGEYYATLARARRCAGALINACDGRVVMIETAYRDFYEIPAVRSNLGRAHLGRALVNAMRNWAWTPPSGVYWRWIIKCGGDQRGESTMYVYVGGSVEPESCGLSSTDEAEVDAIVLVEPADLDSVTPKGPPHSDKPRYGMRCSLAIRSSALDLAWRSVLLL